MRAAAPTSETVDSVNVHRPTSQRKLVPELGKVILAGSNVLGTELRKRRRGAATAHPCARLSVDCNLGLGINISGL